jgi:carbonic anhydrase
MHESLKKLVEGNQRFAQGKSLHPNRSEELRNALLDGQNPYAVVISCSDSRVPVEIIFDVGLGDIFVIRTAGQVLSNESMGSLEYAVTELGVKFVMLMGHDNCGAVKSAMTAYKAGQYAELTPNLKALLNHIYPVFEQMKASDKTSLDDAIMLNIKYQVEDLLKKDAYLAQKVAEKKIMIVGAKYSLDTGLVEILH